MKTIYLILILGLFTFKNNVYASDKILDSILPIKDVDGFHAENVGKLWSGLNSLVPCTPLGCSILLK